MIGVTIHTYGGRRWDGAQVVGLGYDTLTDECVALIVRHPDFEGDLDFSVQSDHEGRHLNVGNDAFWITTVE